MTDPGQPSAAASQDLFFVSRSYPPILGGLELHNQRLLESLGAHFHTHTVLNPGGKRKLPFFAIRALWILLARTRPGDIILFGDLLIASLAPLLQLVVPRRRWIACAHGLDVVWTPSIYQRWVTRAVLPSLSMVIAVSDATRQAVLDRGLPAERAYVVANGTDPVPLMDPNEARCKIEARHNVVLRDRYVILSLGRLAHRKSVGWFVKHVMPELPPDTVLLIAGDGPDRPLIEAAINERGLSDSVHLLGLVPDEERAALYNAADVFVMPNRPVPGDMEGFGITRLEAASVGLPIVASNLEGLRGGGDCGTTLLARPGDVDDFVAAIQDVRSWNRLEQARDEARARIIREYSWVAVAAQYARILATPGGSDPKTDQSRAAGAS